MLLRCTATTTCESLQQRQTYLFQIPLHSLFQYKKILWAAENTSSIYIYDSDDNLHINFLLNFISLIYIRICLVKNKFGSWQWGEFAIVEYFRIKFLFASNQMVFRFESNYFSFRIKNFSNYFSNRSRANSMVRQKSYNPIILELKPDAVRDIITLCPISNSLLSNNMSVRPSAKAGRRDMPTPGMIIDSLWSNKTSKVLPTIGVS